MIARRLGYVFFAFAGGVTACGGGSGAPSPVPELVASDGGGERDAGEGAADAADDSGPAVRPRSEPIPAGPSYVFTGGYEFGAGQVFAGGLQAIDPREPEKPLVVAERVSLFTHVMGGTFHSETVSVSNVFTPYVVAVSGSGLVKVRAGLDRLPEKTSVSSEDSLVFPGASLDFHNVCGLRVVTDWHDLDDSVVLYDKGKLGSSGCFAGSYLWMARLGASAAEDPTPVPYTPKVELLDGETGAINGWLVGGDCGSGVCTKVWKTARDFTGAERVPELDAMRQVLARLPGGSLLIEVGGSGEPGAVIYDPATADLARVRSAQGPAYFSGFVRDREHIYLSAIHEASREGGIYRLSLAAGESRELVRMTTELAPALWQTDGQLVFETEDGIHVLAKDAVDTASVLLIAKSSASNVVATTTRDAIVYVKENALVLVSEAGDERGRYPDAHATQLRVDALDFGARASYVSELPKSLFFSLSDGAGTVLYELDPASGDAVPVLGPFDQDRSIAPTVALFSAEPFRSGIMYTWVYSSQVRRYYFDLDASDFRRLPDFDG